LNNRSSARVAKDEEFKYISEDSSLVQKRLDENRISLNLGKRKAEIEDEKSRKEKRKTARANAAASTEKRFAITLDNVSKPGLEPYTEKKETRAIDRAEDPENADPEDEDPAKTVDAVRNETLNILSDLVQLDHGPRTAQTAPAKK
jgi:carboxyl-terminal processing protease